MSNQSNMYQCDVKQDVTQDKFLKLNCLYVLNMGIGRIHAKLSEVAFALILIDN